MKLIASDFDGTMLRPDSTISEYSKDVVRKLYKTGEFIFIPTTGRCFRSIASKIGDVEEIRYFNTSNGCVLYDRQEDSYIINHVLPNDLAYDIYKEVKELGGAMETYSGLDSYLEPDMFPLAMVAFNKELSEDLYKTTVPMEGMEEMIRSGEMKVNKYNAVFRKPEDKQKIFEKYSGRDDIIVTIPTIYNLEIFYAGVDKDTGLRVIGEREEIAHEDTIAIGDSINDVEMVRYAHLGLAVANAMEPLKEVADQIILSNAEDGPAKYMESLIRDNSIGES